MLTMRQSHNPPQEHSKIKLPSVDQIFQSSRHIEQPSPVHANHIIRVQHASPPPTMVNYTYVQHSLEQQIPTPPPQENFRRPVMLVAHSPLDIQQPIPIHHTNAQHIYGSPQGIYYRSGYEAQIPTPPPYQLSSPSGVFVNGMFQPMAQIGYIPVPQAQVMEMKRKKVSKQATAWAPKEDKLLRHLKEVKKLGWREISTFFTDRTPNACQFRWRRIVSGMVTSTHKEDIVDVCKRNQSIRSLLN